MLEDTDILPDEDAERQIKIRNIEYKPMDIEEAVLQMDLIEDNFLVFTNARSDRINVLYRRKDGHYGLIQPNSWFWNEIPDQQFKLCERWSSPPPKVTW